MHIVIPDELVPLLRDGLYFDLHGQLEEAGTPKARQPTTPANPNVN